MSKSERFYERVVLVIILAVYSFLMYTAVITKSDYSVNGNGPMDFPKWMIGAMIVLCAGRLADNVLWWSRNRATTQAAEKVDRRIYFMMVLIVIYAALWNVLGFCLSTFAFVMLSAQVLKPSNSWLKSALVGLLVTVVVYVVFGMLFRVNFPEPILDLIAG